GVDTLRRLLAVKSADAQSCHRDTASPDHSEYNRLIDEILAENACLTVADLVIDGHDLLSLGYPAGKMLGDILRGLLDAVLNDECANTAEALILYTKERWPI
ncbi:MAG: polynucleotide adenylyltransferase, partial [Clostridia bacterium]|nr:polynucleotide adenylyltransferase [Clostridia bacterium]